MNIHEFQAKQLLADAGIAVPRGVLLERAEDAAAAVASLAGDVHVVKAQSIVA